MRIGSNIVIPLEKGLSSILSSFLKVNMTNLKSLCNKIYKAHCYYCPISMSYAICSISSKLICLFKGTYDYCQS
jgi:hypothetical protein